MAFDPMRIAQQIVNKEEGQRSLVPLMPSAPDIPDRPVYTPPAREEFSWEVPMSERPPGTEDWIWTKTLRAKDDWNTEQARIAQEAQNKYSADLSAWQDAMNIANKRYEQEVAMVNDYYGQQGLITPLAGDVTPVIRQAQGQWQAANELGDRVSMDYWHNVAEQARMGAGWGSGGLDGSLTSRYMTSAGLPSWERQYKDTQYADALDQQQWERDLAERQLAQSYALGSARASGSGGGSTTAQIKAMGEKALADAFNSVGVAVRKGDSYSTIRDGIISQAGQLRADGVDYMEVLAYLEQLREEGLIEEDTPAKESKFSFLQHLKSLAE